MRRLTNILLVLLAAYFITQAVYSTRWQIAHDEAPLLYEAFLMRADGLVPYRDLFDFQMPGSFIAYFLLGSLSGFDAFRLRLLDLLILAAILTITYFAIQRFGKAPALAAALLFGLKYLQGGPSMSLQREYLLLIFLAPAVYISLLDEMTPRLRLTLGVLFGLSALIKPHAAIGLSRYWSLTSLIWSNASSGSAQTPPAPASLPVAAGFLVPILAVFAWLGFTGALTPFLTIATNYWGLYSQINGQMEITSGSGANIPAADSNPPSRRSRALAHPCRHRHLLQPKQKDLASCRPCTLLRPLPHPLRTILPLPLHPLHLLHHPSCIPHLQPSTFDFSHSHPSSFILHP